jgi:hypothetical protein
VEWTLFDTISLRSGVMTDNLQTLGPEVPTAGMVKFLAGLTTGVGVHAWGQELDYAWLPYGQIGSVQYFSLVLRFGQVKNAVRAPGTLWYEVSK